MKAQFNFSTTLVLFGEQLSYITYVGVQGRRVFIKKDPYEPACKAAEWRKTNLALRVTGQYPEEVPLPDF